MTLPIVNPTNFGACLHYSKGPDGATVGFGIYQDVLAGFSFVGILCPANSTEWYQWAQTPFYTSEYAVVSAILTNGNVWGNPVNMAGITMTWGEVALTTTPVYNGLYGTDAVLALFDLYLSGRTTQQAEGDTSGWRNSCILAPFQALADATINAVAGIPAVPPTPPIPAPPAAQQEGGIRTGTAMLLATNTMLAGSFAAPLPGSPAPWRFVVGAIAPPATP